MKVAVTILTWMIVPWVIAAEQSGAERPSPKPRVRLDPNSPGAISVEKATPPASGASPAVVMSPYIVRATTDARPAARQLPIPQGAPALSGSPFSDAVQTGIMLERTGKKFTTEVAARLESDPGGFARLKIGYNLSW